MKIVGFHWFLDSLQIFSWKLECRCCVKMSAKNADYNFPTSHFNGAAFSWLKHPKQILFSFLSSVIQDIASLHAYDFIVILFWALLIIGFLWLYLWALRIWFEIVFLLSHGVPWWCKSKSPNPVVPNLFSPEACTGHDIKYRGPENGSFCQNHEVKHEIMLWLVKMSWP